MDPIMRRPGRLSTDRPAGVDETVHTTRETRVDETGPLTDEVTTDEVTTESRSVFTTEPKPTVVNTQPKPPKKRNTLALILALLLLAVAGLAAFLFYNSGETTRQKNDLTSQVTEKDQEISQLRSQLQSQDTETTNPAPTPNTPAAPTQTEAQQAEEAAKLFYMARVAGPQKIADYKAELLQESGNFKRYGLSRNGQPGGASVVVKKVDNKWVGIVGGQQQPSKAEGELYGLPTGWFSTEY